MSGLSIAICDDLIEERINLAKLIQAYCKKCALSPQIHLFSSGEELLEAFTQPGLFQIIFLDIYMPGMSGVDTAKKIRAIDSSVFLLFATTSQDHGMDSFQVQASDYLVKPIQAESVAQAIDWCLEHMPKPLRQLTVLVEGEQRTFPLAVIHYIDVYGHQSRIHTNQELIVTRRGLDDLEAAIDSPDFLRCHRSYLVNMNYIQGMEGNDFQMSDGSLVPIGSTHTTQIRNQFIDWTYLKAWKQE